jgi:hypothetical protein
MTMMGIESRNRSLQAHFGANRNTATGMSEPTLYFALYQGDPFGAGVEPTSTGNYARVAKTNDATLWGTIGSTDTSVSNSGSSGLITWPVATGLYSITTALDHWAVFDNAAGGTLLYAGPLTTGITVTGAGDVPRIPAGSLNISQPG